jgi:hypothetical protein
MAEAAAEWSDEEISLASEIEFSDVMRALQLLREGSPMLTEMARAEAEPPETDDE